MEYRLFACLNQTSDRPTVEEVPLNIAMTFPKIGDIAVADDVALLDIHSAHPTTDTRLALIFPCSIEESETWLIEAEMELTALQKMVLCAHGMLAVKRAANKWLRLVEVME